MGLYVCIFDDEDDIAGVDIGSYSDFGRFREAIAKYLEPGLLGSRFPTLMLHSDCDGQWSAADCFALRGELAKIGEELRNRLPICFPDNWQSVVAERESLRPASLYECFIDVDGENLIERLVALCEVAIDRGLPISFQ